MVKQEVDVPKEYQKPKLEVSTAKQDDKPQNNDLVEAVSIKPTW